MARGRARALRRRPSRGGPGDCGWWWGGAVALDADHIILAAHAGADAHRPAAEVCTAPPCLVQRLRHHERAWSGFASVRVHLNTPRARHAVGPKAGAACRLRSCCQALQRCAKAPPQLDRPLALATDPVAGRICNDVKRSAPNSTHNAVDLVVWGTGVPLPASTLLLEDTYLAQQSSPHRLATFILVIHQSSPQNMVLRT